MSLFATKAGAYKMMCLKMNLNLTVVSILYDQMRSNFFRSSFFAASLPAGQNQSF
jgi:hypothetical protein